MKKQVVVALALAITSFSFSQKKELKTAETLEKSQISNLIGKLADVFRSMN